MTKEIIGLRKRAIAVLLSVVIAFGSLPILSAFAEPDEAFKGFSGWTLSEKDKLSFSDGITGYAAEITKNSGNAATLTSDLVKVTSNKNYGGGYLSVQTPLRRKPSFQLPFSAMKTVKTLFPIL